MAFWAVFLSSDFCGSFGMSRTEEELVSVSLKVARPPLFTRSPLAVPRQTDGLRSEWIVIPRRSGGVVLGLLSVV